MARKSARAEARKVKDRWKAKNWYNVLAPEIFGAAVIGETLADDPDKLVGRVTQITLQDITGDFSQMHVKLHFKVDHITGLDAHTQFVGHDLTSDYIRRLTRRKHSKMDGVYDITTMDGWRVRIKPMAITERRIKTSQQFAIRKEMDSVVMSLNGRATMAEVVKAMISGELSKSIFRRCKPIYPIKRVEVRRSEVIGRDFVPKTPVREGPEPSILAEPEPEAPPEEEPAPPEEAPAAPEPEAVPEEAAPPEAAPEEAAPEEAAPEEAPAAPEVEEESEVDPETVANILTLFGEIPGIGPSKAQALFDAGYRSIDELRELSLEDMANVEGFSEALAMKVQEALREG